MKRERRRKILFVPLWAGLLYAAVSHGATLVSPFSFYVTTVAGDGQKGNADGMAAVSRFNWPTGVAASGGAVYVADYSNNLVRLIDPASGVRTLAGSGSAGFADGEGRKAIFRGPDGIALDLSGNLYVADADNFSIRKVTPKGAVTTIAGNGIMGYRDGPAGLAMFGYPTGIAVDSNGILYVADRRTHTIRKITPEGGVSTLAGNGHTGYADGKGTKARLKEPIALAVTPGGTVYVSDSGNNAIRRITPDGAVETVAGGRMSGYRDGSGKEAMFSWPTGIAMDARGNIYVCDSNNNKIRRITPEGSVSTVAGGLVPGFLDGWGLVAGFNFPTGVAADGLGNLYVADSGNNRIRKITYGKPLEAKNRVPDAGEERGGFGKGGPVRGY